MSDRKLPRQDTLPFPRKPSGSSAGRTMQESVYSPLPPERHLPMAAPIILFILVDDAGLGLPSTFGCGAVTARLGRGL